MNKVSIKPHWTLSNAEGNSLSSRLLELLVQVNECGSLSAACRNNGSSYRHAWNLVRQGENQMGAPLLRMQRGKGSTLTPLAEKLVWADHRITARLTPLLETLSSELEVEIDSVLAADNDVLRVHASHGFAIESLFGVLREQDVLLERKYVGSTDALVSLHNGNCDLAGFHVPMGEFECKALEHYARWLDRKELRIINLATRHQGLIVAAGNPQKIYGIEDLTRADIRFVNRQRGSGTRFLLDCLLDKAGIKPSRIPGYEQVEYTHAAVAAYVASQMSDAGIGVETPARRFNLEFISLATERYFLLCHERVLQKLQVRQLITVLRSADYQQRVHELQGYNPSRCGEIETLQQAFSDQG